MSAFLVLVLESSHVLEAQHIVLMSELSLQK